MMNKISLGFSITSFVLIIIILLVGFNYKSTQDQNLKDERSEFEDVRSELVKIQNENLILCESLKETLITLHDLPTHEVIEEWKKELEADKNKKAWEYNYYWFGRQAFIAKYEERYAVIEKTCKW